MTPGSVTLRRVGKLKCAKIQNGVTLRGVGLHAVSYCVESNSLIWFSKTSISSTFRFFFRDILKIFRKYFENSKWCHTARSRQLKFTADPKWCDTARSFAGNSFVFAGLSFPSRRILNFYKNICLLLQHSPTFFVSFLKTSLSKIFDSGQCHSAGSRIFRT